MKKPCGCKRLIDKLPKLALVFMIYYFSAPASLLAQELSGDMKLSKAENSLLKNFVYYHQDNGKYYLSRLPLWPNRPINVTILDTQSNLRGAATGAVIDFLKEAYLPEKLNLVSNNDLKTDILFIFSNNVFDDARRKYRNYFQKLISAEAPENTIDDFVAGYERDQRPCFSYMAVNGKFDLVGSIIFVSRRMSDVDLRRCVAVEGLRSLGFFGAGHIDAGQMNTVMSSTHPAKWFTGLDRKLVHQLYGGANNAGIAITDFGAR